MKVCCVSVYKHVFVYAQVMCEDQWICMCTHIHICIVYDILILILMTTQVLKGLSEGLFMFLSWASSPGAVARPLRRKVPSFLYCAAPRPSGREGWGYCERVITYFLFYLSSFSCCSRETIPHVAPMPVRFKKGQQRHNEKIELMEKGEN